MFSWSVFFSFRRLFSLFDASPSFPSTILPLFLMPATTNSFFYFIFHSGLIFLLLPLLLPTHRRRARSRWTSSSGVATARGWTAPWHHLTCDPLTPCFSTTCSAATRPSSWATVRARPPNRSSACGRPSTSPRLSSNPTWPAAVAETAAVAAVEYSVAGRGAGARLLIEIRGRRRQKPKGA